MSDNKETFQESILIKRAKRRLLGAVTILLILLGLSYLFIEDRTGIQKMRNVKVSFLEMNDLGSISKSADKNDDILGAYALIDEGYNFNNKVSNTHNGFFIQVGIFSTTQTAAKLAKVIDGMGLQTKIIPISLNGQERMQLITHSFEDKAKAKIALAKIKEAKLPGIIKQQTN